MVYLGSDSAKAKFDVSLWQNHRYKHPWFDNNQRGFEKLMRWLGPILENSHACLEATGRYGFALARYLCEQGLKVSIVNPAKVKGFASSELSRNKTDKLDAALMARFCKAKTPRLWQAPSEQQASFQALYRRHNSLNGIKTQELNRLRCERSEQVQLYRSPHRLSRRIT